MDSSYISGLIGGAVSVAVAAYVSAKLRGQPADGTLRWGWGLILLGLLCLALVALAVGAFFYDDNIRTDQGEFLAWVGILVGFGAGATYCLVEYFTVRGTYNDTGIEFYTPWTGLKNENWSDLQSIKFSGSMNWYVLKFRDGKTIRLSNMLSGHRGVIQTIERLRLDVR